MADNNVVGGVDENSVRFTHHLIRNSRRRRLMMQLTVHYLFARGRQLLSVCLTAFLMLLSQRRVITQLPIMSKTGNKHWLVGECMEKTILKRDLRRFLQYLG